MWCCQSVWARHIPRNASAHPPWNQGNSVRPLLIGREKAFGFLNCWDPWSDAGPGQQVVQHAMSCETTCTLPTRQTVDPQSINCSTAWADVWGAEVDPQSQADGYPDGFVVKPQSTWADWHGIKPIATVRGLRCQESGFTDVISATISQYSQSIADWCLIPWPLFCGSSVSGCERIVAEWPDLMDFFPRTCQAGNLPVARRTARAGWMLLKLKTLKVRANPRCGYPTPHI